ncbi:hypothetical protein [Moritella sp.]|uniref:helix-turn-helix domain-containing protein n=1 Tax=Moritella sp. TaxID=78556 RepID=UPI003457B392
MACMCRANFFNQFKLQFGCTPLAFQQQKRLKKAAELIKTGMQITQVSFELIGTNCLENTSTCHKAGY